MWQGWGGGREIDFKKLAYVIVRAGKSKVCSAGQHLETQGRGDVAA